MVAKPPTFPTKYSELIQFYSFIVLLKLDSTSIVLVSNLKFLKKHTPFCKIHTSHSFIDKLFIRLHNI